MNLLRLIPLHWSRSEIYLRGNTTLEVGRESFTIGPGAIHFIDHDRPARQIASDHEQLSVFVPYHAIGYDPSVHPAVFSMGLDTAAGRLLAASLEVAFKSLTNLTGMRLQRFPQASPERFAVQYHAPAKLRKTTVSGRRDYWQLCVSSTKILVTPYWTQTGFCKFSISLGRRYSAILPMQAGSAATSSIAGYKEHIGTFLRPIRRVALFRPSPSVWDFRLSRTSAVHSRNNTAWPLRPSSVDGADDAQSTGVGDNSNRRQDITPEFGICCSSEVELWAFQIVDDVL